MFETTGEPLRKEGKVRALLHNQRIPADSRRCNQKPQALCHRRAWPENMRQNIRQGKAKQDKTTEGKTKTAEDKTAAEDTKTAEDETAFLFFCLLGI
jgi:hypothetical protein